MAASIVQSKAAAVNTGDASVDISFNSTPTSGNVVVLCVGSDDYKTAEATDNGVSMTLSNECAQENFMGCYLWWRVSSGGNAFQYNIGSAATSCWILLEISGLDATPYDGSEGQFVQASSESYTTPNLTPTAGDRLLLALMGFTRSANFTTLDTWLNSFTEIVDISTTLGSGTRDQIGIAQRSVTANGSTAYSSGATSDGTGTANSRYGIIIAFEVAAGGTDVTAQPAVVATTTTAPRPNVNISAGPSAVATVAALPRPAVNVQSSPAVVATTVTLPTPTPDTAGNATAIPAAVATVASVPRPGINISAGPAVVPVTVTLPQPGVNIAAGPAVIACTVALATPTATGETVVTPTSVTTTISVNTAALNIGAGPATIAVSVTIPVPDTGGAPVKAFSDPEVVHAVASVAAVTALRTSDPSVLARGTSTPTVG